MIITYSIMFVLYAFISFEQTNSINHMHRCGLSTFSLEVYEDEDLMITQITVRISYKYNK